MSEIKIRLAVKDDTSLILQFIRELAAYEKLEDQVVADESILQKTLFDKNAKAFVIIAETEGKPVGFALSFYNFSTFLGRPGIYLEDLYVKPEYREIGAGKLMLKWLAKKAVSENCGRLEWWVLDWNQSSIEFYKRLGAQAMDDWTVYRLEGESLQKAASTA